MDEQYAAASARLCVETRIEAARLERRRRQPPLRGCVLKQSLGSLSFLVIWAAASARLCVETSTVSCSDAPYKAAASARLCVETFVKILKS